LEELLIHELNPEGCIFDCAPVCVLLERLLLLFLDAD
jgi:hypothetical protein